MFQAWCLLRSPGTGTTRSARSARGRCRRRNQPHNVWSLVFATGGIANGDGDEAFWQIETLYPGAIPETSDRACAQAALKETGAQLHAALAGAAGNPKLRSAALHGK
jgi:hypothetical protein